MTIDPRVGFWFSIVMAIVSALGICGTQLTTLFGDVMANKILAGIVVLNVINGAINAILHAIPSKPGSANEFALGPKAAPAILFAILVLGALAFPGDAMAQVKLKTPQEVGADIKNAFTPSQQAFAPASGTKIGDSSCKATGDPIADLHCVIKAGGAKLILHLKQSYALASAPGPTAGSTTDNTSAMCTKALVPIVDLVVNGPKSGALAAGDPMAFTADETTLAANTSEPDGPIVIIEKIRILRLAIQSPALNDACGALVQDEVKNAQSLVGKITSLVTGAGILAPIGL